MSKKNWSNIVNVLARTALAFVFLSGQSTRAVQGQNATDKSGSNGAAKAKQPPGNLSAAAEAKAQSNEEGTATEENSSKREQSNRGGQNEGIKVHGHWTIEVRNPDGALVTHREFENSLTTGGAASLSLLLSRSVSLGSWSVLLDNPPSGASQAVPPPCLNGSLQTACLIHEPGTAFFPGNNSVFTLSVTSGPGNTLVLSGTVTAGANGDIGLVQTFASLCTNTFAPSAPCSVGAQLPQSTTFTSATLNSPVAVSAGQTIAVTVNISFS